MSRDKNLEIKYKEYESRDELAPDETRLLELAVHAGSMAYAPYSGFYVGAALLLENGEVVTGNNQENAAYPLGLCAERVAFFSARSHYPQTRILKCAIYARSETIAVLQPVTPCGACRQAMAEYEEKQGFDITLIMAGEEGPVMSCLGVHQLLPLAFTRKNLGMEKD